MGYTNAFVWVIIFFFYTKVSFFENLMKKLIATGVVRKNFFSLPVPKIKFEPPPQCKSTLVFIFWIFH